jgi:hypothetical protein
MMFSKAKTKQLIFGWDTKRQLIVIETFIVKGESILLKL